MSKPFLTALAVVGLALAPAAVQARQEPGGTPPARSQARLNLDTPISTIVADAGGRAVIVKHMPMLLGDEGMQRFGAGSIKDMSTDPHVAGFLDAAKLAQIEADLAAVR